MNQRDGQIQSVVGEFVLGIGTERNKGNGRSLVNNRIRIKVWHINLHVYSQKVLQYGEKKC